MPSADNDSVKDVFRAVKQLKKITEHLADTGALTLNKYLDRVPTDEDVKTRRWYCRTGNNKPALP
ncbi:hypothetical protein [Xenorhabdus bovienii]|uniref:Uncharacterized protein n=2 Tax=Xenorhabdus bovienii TaxID=40576 RepID=A0A077QND3_XENBV|nr:hypothetical protein [Xenorhabdus bovienii]CDH35069.1 hypothetical protein XBI1_780010 [Xenorhabdus bovienii str. Intermedium]